MNLTAERTTRSAVYYAARSAIYVAVYYVYRATYYAAYAANSREHKQLPV